MSRRPPERVVQDQAEEDRVAAALRDAGEPLTATTIGVRLPWALFTRCGCSDVRARRSWSHFGGGLDIDRRESMTSGSVTTHLARLHQRGLVDREKVGTRIFWRWVGPAVEMEALELAFVERSID